MQVKPWFRSASWVAYGFCSLLLSACNHEHPTVPTFPNSGPISASLTPSVWPSPQSDEAEQAIAPKISEASHTLTPRETPPAAKVAQIEPAKAESVLETIPEPVGAPARSPSTPPLKSEALGKSTHELPVPTPKTSEALPVPEARTGSYVSRHATGQIFARGELKNGREEGAWSYFYPSGKLRVTLNYREGRFDGTWTILREDSTQQVTESYLNGQRHGQWVYYDPSGKIIIDREQYAHGLRHGTWQRFYPSGKPEGEERYVQGNRDGEQIIWYENGQKARENHYHQGLRQGRQTAWDLDGTLLGVVEYYGGYRASSLLDAQDEDEDAADAEDPFSY